MEISFDPNKRALTLANRELDFADAPRLFAGLTHTGPDERFDYSKPRFQTYGLPAERLVMVVWAETDGRLRIISKARSESNTGSGIGWIDPDDAPERTDEMFDTAEIRVGDRIIRPGKWRTAGRSPEPNISNESNFSTAACGSLTTYPSTARQIPPCKAPFAPSHTSGVPSATISPPLTPPSALGRSLSPPSR